MVKKEYQPDKVFLPYQQELMRAGDANPVVVVEKSRRTGYSWAMALIAVLHAAREERPQNVFYMGYNLEMAREFIKYAGSWATQIGEAASAVEEYVFKDPENPDKDIKAFRVTLANRQEIIALPSSPRALRGMQGLVIIDEAAFHDELKEVLKAAFALLMWGGQVVVISTHNGDDNYFNELVQDIRAGKTPYKLLRCTFQDALRDGLYRRICKTQDIEWSAEKEAAWVKSIYDFYGDSADEELDCIPANGSGSYLSRVIIEHCMRDDVPVLSYGLPDSFSSLPEGQRFDIVQDWLDENLMPVLDGMNKMLPSSIGYDFARNGDLSCVWCLQETQTLNLNTAFVLELRNVPHEQQKQIAFYIIDRLPKFRFGAFDARGNGSYLAEVCWQKYGASRVEQVMLTTDWYRQNTPRAKAYLEDKKISIPRNADILQDFKQVKLVKGVAQVPDARTKDARGNKRHGDSFIAYSFAIYAMKKEGTPVYDGLMTSKDLFDDDEEKGFRREGTW